jgi:hypothetical protein
VKLYPTDHAVERYVERFKPQLGFDLAKRELQALIDLAEPCAKPRWFKGHREADRYLQLTPEVVAASIGRVVTTVVAQPPLVGGRRRTRRLNRRARHRWKEDHARTLPHLKRKAA